MEQATNEEVVPEGKQMWSVREVVFVGQWKEILDWKNYTHMGSEL